VLCDLDEDAERASKRLLDRTRLPMLTNVTLAGSALVAQAPELLPDVFEAAPFVAAVELRAGELVVRGELAHGAWEQRITVPACAAGAGNQAIVGLFGREHVADLEARGFAGASTDADIERTGLRFQIATRLTSWIAIDEARTVTGPARHESVPQALPYGTTAAAFGLRAQAPMQPRANAMFGFAQGLDAPDEYDDREALEFDADEARAFDSGGLDDLKIGTSAERSKDSGPQPVVARALAPAAPSKTRSIANNAAPAAPRPKAEAEAAPRDAPERKQPRRDISELRQRLGNKADKEVSASVSEAAPVPEANEPSSTLRKSTAPMQVAVGKAVAAAQRAQHGTGRSTARRAARLPLAVVLLILALVIAALAWWFVA
jgi:Ca-activated chloride channel family protein